MCSVDRGWVNMNAYYFQWTQVHQVFFCLTLEGLSLITCFSNFLISLFIPGIFAIQTCSILGVFALPNFRGWPPPKKKKLYPNYHVCLAARHVEKFSEATSSSPRIIGAHMLNFNPIFTCPFLKIVGDSIAVGCVLASFGHSVAHVKI